MLVVLVLVLVVLVGLWALARRGVGRDRSAEIGEVETSSQTVGYDIPADAEPTAVLTALRTAGFSAVADPVHPRRLTIMLPMGAAQLDAVRRVLPGDAVRFDDEP